MARAAVKAVVAVKVAVKAVVVVKVVKVVVAVVAAKAVASAEPSDQTPPGWRAAMNQVSTRRRSFSDRRRSFFQVARAGRAVIASVRHQPYDATHA